MEKYNFKDYVSGRQVYGNTRIIEIDILVPKEFSISNITEIDAIRNEIDQRNRRESIGKMGDHFFHRHAKMDGKRLFARRR